MKRTKQSITAIVIALLTASCNTGSSDTEEANYEVVPLPGEIAMHEGTPFILSGSTHIVFPEGNEKMQRNAGFLAEYLALSTGIKPAVTTDTPERNAIILSTGLDSKNPEAYRITINEQAIRIDGASEAAVFYGIQTLRKATPVERTRSISYAPATINDAPRFAYRGMMLDIARHFQPVEFIKKYIDLLALHNINRFHWHLTDDQGWRIEIDAYPKLTEIGSMRKETVIGRNSGEYDGIPHGGFYTKEELRDVVAYAQEHYITVIPEVDLPGHMLAALTAYPELGCTGGPYEVEGSWGVFDDVLCAGNDSTFIFLEAVLTEVMEIFPSEYLHIGGDESPKTRWEECPRCQARIKELGLKDRDGHTAEHYLQSYVTARIEQFLNSHGRRIIGWDEILEGELAPNATVMSWRGMGGGIEAARMGHDVVMTPTTYAYFDYYQTHNTEEEPFGIGGYLPLEQVYSFEPAPETLTSEQKSHILGAQANLWTEYIKTPDHVEYMLLPRMAAMSEVQWIEPEKKDYHQFLSRLPQLLALYDKLEYNYATHVFDVQATLTPNIERNVLDVEFSTVDDAPVYYTLDGSEPTEASVRYEGRFSIQEDATLKAVALRKGGQKSRVFSETITVSRSSYKPVELLTNPASGYAYTGAGMLIDGLNGNSTNYRTGRWMGFQRDDLVAVIDMLEPTGISSAEIRNAVVTGDWIFNASVIEIASSADNKHFTTVATEKIIDEEKDNYEGVFTHTLSFDPVTARYFKVTVKTSVIPEWHPGKGGKGFIFVDEIRLD
ncbi:glycoside hydrolase family 20 protein [uncultured Proteiniphilum sp.]|uniref:glycoside hydrolase family 20 protein n=1 Tax=uncultured Proteiniphilum sp. TaxID=497637 RepID=UPI0026260C38|nr:glycoside hydrolase family 20 protein [uncultured Proteiniphilum sp.]